MCPVNGIRDLVHWRTGRNWSNNFVYGLGLGGGFAYLRFKAANPPRQVYWGIAGPRQHKYLAKILGASYHEVENRTFKFSWARAKEALDAGRPVIIGPLDMYYLHFYEDIYRKRHIPIHYLLLVGYTEDHAVVLDTDHSQPQILSLKELEQAWNVSVPGLGRRNRLVVLDIPEEIAPTVELIKRSLTDECNVMLRPPVSMVGIPAMEKVAREIGHWVEEFENEVMRTCVDQVRTYLSSPPDLEGSHLTAGRDIYISFLEEAALESKLDLSQVIILLQSSMGLIPDLASTLRANQLVEAGKIFEQIAEKERKAYTSLERVLTAGKA